MKYLRGALVLLVANAGLATLTTWWLLHNQPLFIALCHDGMKLKPNEICYIRFEAPGDIELDGRTANPPSFWANPPQAAKPQPGTPL